MDPFVGQPVSSSARVFQDDHVSAREIAAFVAPVKITTERQHAIFRRRPGGRQMIHQERHYIFVEPRLVMELNVVSEQHSHVAVPVFHLEHETTSADQALAVADGHRAENHGGRELILFGERVVQFKRHEPAIRTERPGARDFRDHLRPVHRAHRV